MKKLDKEDWRFILLATLIVTIGFLAIKWGIEIYGSIGGTCICLNN